MAANPSNIGRKSKQPELFNKRTYNQPELDTKSITKSYPPKALLMPDQIKSQATEAGLLWQRSRHLRYLAIGAWNTLAGYAIFAGLYLVLSPHLGYMIIAAISHLFAVTQSFIAQRWIVFRSTQHWPGEYLRFHIAHLGSLAVGLTLLPLMVEGFHMPPLTGQAIVTALIVVASYFVHQHFTFRKAKDV